MIRYVDGDENLLAAIADAAVPREGERVYFWPEGAQSTDQVAYVVHHIEHTVAPDFAETIVTLRKIDPIGQQSESTGAFDALEDSYRVLLTAAQEAAESMRYGFDIDALTRLEDAIETAKALHRALGKQI